MRGPDLTKGHAARCSSTPNSGPGICNHTARGERIRRGLGEDLGPGFPPAAAGGCLATQWR
jgi:hypothetical protein